MHGSRTSAVSPGPPRFWSPASRRFAAWGAGLLLAAGSIVAVAGTWRGGLRVGGRGELPRDPPLDPANSERPGVILIRRHSEP
jgi:hypothetical protein